MFVRGPGVARGPYADQMLSQVRVRKTILSTAAVSEEGFFNNNLLLIETERAMMRAGQEVIVVVDSTKFGNQSLGHVCPLGGRATTWSSTRGLSERVARRRSSPRA